MGRAAGVKKRRAAKGRPGPSQNAVKKLKKRRIGLNKIETPIIRDKFNMKSSIKSNFEKMGILYDPNSISRIPRPIEEIIPLPDKKKLKIKRAKKKEEKKIKERKTETIEAIESHIKKARAKKADDIHLGPDFVLFVSKMIAKHGDNYEGMERDPENYFQHPAGHMRKLCRRFNQSKLAVNSFNLAREMIEEMSV